MTLGETRVVQWWVRLVGAILLLLLVFLAYARVGAAALAGSRPTAGARRLAGSGNVGIASGAGTIRRVDHRNEEHPVGLLLSACYFLLFAITRSQAKWNLLLADNLLFRRRDHEQTIDRNADEGAGG